MFKHIVVALDGSACAADALDVALSLAKTEGAQLALCSVINPFPLNGMPPEAAVRAYSASEEAATHFVENGLAKAKAAGIVAEGRVIQGEPVYEIEAYARKKRADTIVMGTHGRSGLKRFLMGSVAEAVLRSASVPVVIVREKARIEAASAKS